MFYCWHLLLLFVFEMEKGMLQYSWKGERQVVCVRQHEESHWSAMKKKHFNFYLLFCLCIFFFVCFVVPVKLGNNKMIYYNKQCCCFGQYFNIQTLQSFIF